MRRVLEDRDTQTLVEKDDGEVELISWSALNRLVYKHGLEGLLKTGTDILTISDDNGPDVQVIPNEDATEYDLTVGEDTIHLSPHQKSALVETLASAYESDDDEPRTQPFIDWASELLDTDANPLFVDQFAETPAFEEHVEVTQNGWLIHDHLLLTYDNEFYHPNVPSRRSWSAEIKTGDSQAYRINWRTNSTGQAELSDFDRIGDASDQQEFIARAIWAVNNAPILDG